MPKVKYHFNIHSLKYEKVVVSIWKRVGRVLGFLSTAVVFASVILFFAYNYLDSPKEKQLKREIGQLQLQYDLLNDRLSQVNAVIADLQDRDDNIYRTIFEAEPIPENIRKAGFGGVNKYKDLERFDNADLVIETTKKLDKISKELYVQSKSFDEIMKLAKDKQEMLASIPAIQPISNKNLKMIASGFGHRVDPVYKTIKFHEGIDFTAAVGTPIYATGNGVITTADMDKGGYGRCVVISHGFGYQSLYGHCSRLNVRPGQKVKRGDIIGFVGSTGKSTGPHVHYEVIKAGTKINPINFFFNDLTANEYDEVLTISSQSNQSFD